MNFTDILNVHVLNSQSMRRAKWVDLFSPPADEIRHGWLHIIIIIILFAHDTIRDAILTCARKPT